MLTDLHTPRFTFQHLSFVTGLPLATIKAWHARGILVMSEIDRAATGRGSVALFSGYTSLQVVIMAELTRLGVPVPAAAQAGMNFSHSGIGPSGWLGEGALEDNDPPRNPGALYAEGQTVLLVGFHRPANNVRSQEWTSDVINVRSADDLTRELGYFDDAVVVLHLNAVIETALHRLDRMPKSRATT